jgi:hypothetical protein
LNRWKQFRGSFDNLGGKFVDLVFGFGEELKGDPIRVIMGFHLQINWHEISGHSLALQNPKIPDPKSRNIPIKKIWNPENIQHLMLLFK